MLQASLPNAGPGAVPAREIQAGSGGQDKNAGLLGPATDFYKKLALDCSGQQVRETLTKRDEKITFLKASEFLNNRSQISHDLGLT